MSYNRILAFGDIHGCLNTLNEMLEEVCPTQDDLMVFCGDYVDRGANSYGVIERLIKLKEEFPNTVFLMGNHEDMFVRYLKYPDRESTYMFMVNGGRETLLSYDEALGYKPHNFDELPESHQKFLNELKYMHEEDLFYFVHGGLLPEVAIEEQEPHDMMWIRDSFLWNVQYDFGKTVVHGHTPMEQEEIRKYHEMHSGERVNLDSGCVFGLFLTCMDVLNGDTFKVRCKDKKYGNFY